MKIIMLGFVPVHDGTRENRNFMNYENYGHAFNLLSLLNTQSPLDGDIFMRYYLLGTNFLAPPAERQRSFFNDELSVVRQLFT